MSKYFALMDFTWDGYKVQAGLSCSFIRNCKKKHFFLIISYFICFYVHQTAAFYCCPAPDSTRQLSHNNCSVLLLRLMNFLPLSQLVMNGKSAKSIPQMTIIPGSAQQYSCIHRGHSSPGEILKPLRMSLLNESSKPCRAYCSNLV